MAEIMYNKTINKPSPIHYIVLFIVFLLPPIKTKNTFSLKRQPNDGCLFRAAVYGPRKLQHSAFMGRGAACSAA